MRGKYLLERISLQKNQSMKLIRILTKGGKISVTDLKRVTFIANGLFIEKIFITERQELAFYVDEDETRSMHNRLDGIEFEIGTTGKQNYVTSVLASNIMPCTYWLKESIYNDILDSLIPSKLKINISDLKQDIVFSFTGDINFVASDTMNYWNVFLQFPNDNEHKLLPFLIHSSNINQAILLFESYYAKKIESIELFTKEFLHDMGHLAQPVEVWPEVNVPEYYNYTGITSYGTMFWVGFRPEYGCLSTEFLKALVLMCERNQLGTVHLTPWNSVIIKDIPINSLNNWKYFAYQYNIFADSTSYIQNWTYKPADADAQFLSQKLARLFSKNKKVPNGEIIGINTDIKYTFANIIIKYHPLKIGKVHLWGSYEILVRNDFSPLKNTFTSIGFAIFGRQLKTILAKAKDLYNIKAYKERAAFVLDSIPSSLQPENAIEEYVYECGDCLNIYDSKYGDVINSVEPGTNFEMLHSSYCCPTCGANKDSFVKKSIERQEI